MKAIFDDKIDSMYLKHMLEITKEHSDLFNSFYKIIDAFMEVDFGPETKGSIEETLKPIELFFGKKKYETTVNTVNSFKSLIKYEGEIKKEAGKTDYKTGKPAVEEYIKLLIEKEGEENYLKRAEYVSEMIGFLQDFCNPEGFAGRMKLMAGKKFLSGWLESKKPGSGKDVEEIIKKIQENNDELDSLKEVIVKKEREYVKKIKYNGGK